MSCTRASLREMVNGLLLPELHRLGFVGPARIEGNALAHEFRRAAGARGTDVILFQWEKHARPRFLLRLHVEPPEGLDAVMARGGTILTGALTPRRGASTRAWFRADPTWWERWTGGGSTDGREPVEACVALLPEMESWWDAPRTTPHIATWPVTYAASASSSVRPTGASRPR